MLLGTIKKLVHLSQQTHLPNARLVPGHNDKGYGILVGQDGRDVYFSHELVTGWRGFDELCAGQQLEYSLEDAAYLRAATVKAVAVAPTGVLLPAA